MYAESLVRELYVASLVQELYMVIVKVFCLFSTGNDDEENKEGQFMGGALASNGDRFIVSVCMCISTIRLCVCVHVCVCV